MFTRKNVYKLGGDWGDAILWYARAVQAMKARKLAEPLSWRFFGGIHGFDQGVWQSFGYLAASDKLPSAALRKRFWEQCQHATWYFLPWHRGYLLAIEKTVRDVIASLPKGGATAAKTWALPYWNYSVKNENKLPPAFASPDWPDGKGNNPLFVTQRYGPNFGSNKVFVPPNQINLKALGEPDFTGVTTGGSTGFGGVETGFQHGSNSPRFGRLEQQPHNNVHVLVGGGDPTNQNVFGLMTDPDTAGLDPIFYLHHANIDRLWAVWNGEPASKGDPTDAQWVKGPASIGERKFSMPLPPNGDPWDYTPGDMTDIGKLGYTYDDLKAPAAKAMPHAKRLAALGAAPRGVVGMTRDQKVELMGANEKALRISGKAEVKTSVKLDKQVRKRVSNNLAAVRAEATTQPDRVFLNIENVRGLHDATALQVFVKDELVDTIALFGARKATTGGGGHGEGGGLTFVLDISEIVDKLHLSNALDVNALDVRIVPVNPVPEAANVSIGRIRVFRQGR